MGGGGAHPCAILGKLRELPLAVHLSADLIGFRLASHAAGQPISTALPVREVMGRPLSGWGRREGSRGLRSGKHRGCSVSVACSWSLIAVAVKLESRGPVIFRQDAARLQQPTVQDLQVPDDASFAGYRASNDRSRPRADDPTVDAARTHSATDEPRRTAAAVQCAERHDVNGRATAACHRSQRALCASRSVGILRGIAMKPGMTGWAQVNGLRGQTDTPEKMEARVQARHLLYGELVAVSST